MTSYYYSLLIIVIGVFGFLVQVGQLLFKKEKKWYKRITAYGWIAFVCAVFMGVLGTLGLNASELRSSRFAIWKQTDGDLQSPLIFTFSFLI